MARRGRAVGVDKVVPRGLHTGCIDFLRNSLAFLTYPGESMQSRVGYEILHAAGLKFLAADDHNSYVA